MALKAGCVLGRYTLTERLGAGGNATVFRALADNEDEVAIKVLHSDLVHEEDLIRFERSTTSCRWSITIAFSVFSRPGVQKEDTGSPWSMWMERMFRRLPIGGIRKNPPDRWKRIEKVLRGLAEAGSSTLPRNHSSGFEAHKCLGQARRRAQADGFWVIKAPDVFSTNLTVAGRLVGTVAFMAPGRCF